MKQDFGDRKNKLDRRMFGVQKKYSQKEKDAIYSKLEKTVKKKMNKTLKKNG